MRQPPARLQGDRRRALVAARARLPLSAALLAVLALLACSLPARLLGTPAPPTAHPAPTATRAPRATRPPEPAAVSGGLGRIVFCEDVTDAGEPVNPGRSFPAGTTTVWALFTYWDMADGQAWGRAWTWDDEPYITALDERWEDGPEGWVAYAIGDEADGPLAAGTYRLSLYLGAEQVQSATFAVGAEGAPAEPEGPPEFGAIQFASAVTDDAVPLDPADEFAAGIEKLYGVFAYTHLTAGQPWTCEWLRNDEVLVAVDFAWDEGPNGLTWCSFVNAEEDALATGTYTLNLYLAGELAQTGAVDIIATAAAHPAPGDPEDLIDPELIPAWEILYYADNEVMADLGQFVLDHHIEIHLSDDLGTAVASYRYSAASCELPGEERTPGTVYVSVTAYNERPWEELAAALAHELTHASQHLDDWTRCEGCSIESEYYAFVAQFYVLQETGRADILEDRYGGLWDPATGEFDKDALWEWLQDNYTECPDY